MFHGTPLGFETGGLPDEIQNLKHEDIQRYIEEYYSPANAVSVLISRHAPDDFFQLIDQEVRGLNPGKRHQLDQDFAVKPISNYVGKYGCDETSDTVFVFKGMFVDLVQNIELKDGMLLDIVHYILHDAPGACITKAIEESGLCDSFTTQSCNDIGVVWLIVQMQCH